MYLPVPNMNQESYELVIFLRGSGSRAVYFYRGSGSNLNNVDRLFIFKFNVLSFSPVFMNALVKETKKYI